MTNDEKYVEFLNKNNDVTFKDEIIVGNLGGLNFQNLMEYFSHSPFFISNNINYMCNFKNIDMNSNKTKYQGYEYTFLEDRINPFVILLIYRNYNKEKKLAYYYCWPDGEIKMAPNILNTFSSFIHTISSDCEDIISILDACE